MTDQVILQRADLEAAVMKANDRLEKAIETAQGQAKDAGSAAVEAKAAVDKLAAMASKATDDAINFDARLTAMEQRNLELPTERKADVGDLFVKSEAYRAMAEGRQGRARMEFKTAIINTFPASSVQPLVQGDRIMSIHTTPNRRLTLRDLLPSMPTTSNLIEFTRENVYTNNAGPQRDASSPMAAVENVAKPESAITFALATTPVVTLAHWIPLSKQVMADSPMLSAYIGGRLLYGLKLKEETQLLLGLGTGNELQGLQVGTTAYVPESPQLTNKIDIIRDAITQAQVAEYSPNFIVLNPADWDTIQRLKTGISGDRTYVYGDPNMSWAATPLWGLTPIVTNSQTSGKFLLGDTNGCMVFDREQASVEMSYEDSVNFQKNMVTVRAEERLALAKFRTEAFIYGNI